MTYDSWKMRDPDWEWLGPEPEPYEEEPEPEEEEGNPVHLELDPEILDVLETIGNITGKSLRETIGDALDLFVQKTDETTPTGKCGMEVCARSVRL
jgi:hypothetical protein